MNLFLYTITLSVLSLDLSAAFLKDSPLSPRTPFSLNAVQLEPEPEGGEELTAIDTMPGSRMKNMGEVSGVANDDGTVYDFWMTASAEGKVIKEINTKVLKDASKQANFPGFRKVRLRY